MKKINLTRNKFTLVDDEDFEELNKYKWYCTYWGYAVRDVWKDKKTIFMHRHLMSVNKGFYCDHINGDKLDNRKSNLRICSNAQNIRNSKLKINNTSGYKGVSFDKERNKWAVKIKVNYKGIFLGRFDSKLEAAKAYNIAAREYFGDFALLNKI